MDGIHDLGGRQGYGPIDVGEPEEPFHEAWEARMLGIVRSMSRVAPWSIDWFRHVRELIEPVDYLTRPYYDQWLQTYAAMMVNSGVATVGELASGKSAAAIPGLAPPMTPDKVAAATRNTARFDRPATEPPRFTVGEAVRARIDANPGHTRLPQYVRGRRGEVTAHHGAHVFPDASAAGEERPETLYTVCFAATELWPEATAAGDRVYLDLWESYLDAA
ncbi:MAG: nitrile hydratase subunit beta [Bauldia sp.]|uniref:nitrile hydratase subunit beta n=1 Tax=Bauldia sp. TaxID=2575872 RepID=UPI001DA2D148|nr:nitrile hydratase subunit beta [Bauldia sp.]MCB1497854.1 nitrile hydratase subunit beta [Bauldia sp.]